MRSRAAASSIGERQAVEAAADLGDAGAASASSAKPGRTAAARSANSCTASASASASTGCSTSPGTPSGSRLVASTRSRGHAVSSHSVSPATAATRCSQLSSTRTVSRPSSAVSSRVIGSGASAPPSCSSGSPTEASRAAGSCAGSVSAASSATTAARARWAAPARDDGAHPGAGSDRGGVASDAGWEVDRTRVSDGGVEKVGRRKARASGANVASRARRVFPAPPGPVRVTRRAVCSSAWIRATSASGRRSWRARPSGGGGRGRGAQHRHAGLGQLRPRVDPQLVGEPADRGVERGEGVGLAARGVQGPAEQRGRGLPQRGGGELGGERVEIGDESEQQREPGPLLDR